MSGRKVEPREHEFDCSTVGCLECYSIDNCIECERPNEDCTCCMVCNEPVQRCRCLVPERSKGGK